MRKLVATSLFLLLLTGCGWTNLVVEPRLEQALEPPEQSYCQTVGEEVPPTIVRGRTYNRAEQLQPPTTEWGKISGVLQYFWSIGSEFK